MVLAGTTVHMGLTGTLVGRGWLCVARVLGGVLAAGICIATAVGAYLVGLDTPLFVAGGEVGGLISTGRFPQILTDGLGPLALVGLPGAIVSGVVLGPRAVTGKGVIGTTVWMVLGTVLLGALWAALIMVWYEAPDTPALLFLPRTLVFTAFGLVVYGVPSAIIVAPFAFAWTAVAGRASALIVHRWSLPRR